MLDLIGAHFPLLFIAGVSVFAVALLYASVEDAIRR